MTESFLRQKSTLGNSAQGRSGKTMNEQDWLGSDNRSRLKELAKAAYSVDAITSKFAAQDQSSQRDAALILFRHVHTEPPSPMDTALLKALGQTLKPRTSSDDDDALAAANTAEASLAALYAMKIEQEEAIDDDLILSIVGYTEGGRPWTTQAAASTAGRLLEKYLSNEDKKQEFIIRNVLQRYMRPIFSKSTASVTAEGRPALFRDPAPEGGFHAQKASWKDAGPHIVHTFNWSIQASEPDTIKKHWPLYIPVLVTLTEDDDVTVRQRGIDILNAFLTKCPIDILRSSGIDAVFQAAIFPSLLFLPTLTPEDESVPLLRAAYRTLLTLAHADPEPAGKKRRMLLDKMLRDGVLAGYFHASQHIRVVEVLMQSAAQIIEGLQIYAVKHLQILLDLFAPVLTDSFALAFAPAVLSAAKALNATIINCWPRIVGTPHAEQIINLVARSWTNIHDTTEKDKSREFEDLSTELTKTATLLAALWKESGEPVPTEKLAQVVSKAPHLEPLFKPLQLEA